MKKIRPIGNKSRGFSLAEVMVAAVILGIAGLSAMRLFGGLVRSQAEMGRSQLAQELVQDLIEEIKQQRYLDENNNATVLGLNSGESGSDRTGYDDVDDYDGLIEQPPQTRDGVAYSGAEGLTRTTQVFWVSGGDFNTAVNSDNGYKKVIIRVKDAEKELAHSEFVITNDIFDVVSWYGG